MGICFFGVGDCDTTTTTNITDVTNNNTEINNSIKTKINQDCSQQLSQSNTINIVGSDVRKLNAVQKNSVQSMCIMQSILKSNVSADVVNKLLDKIKSNVETTGALLGSPASNNTIIKKMTNNSTKIDNSKFNDISKKCILDLNQANLLNIIGSHVEDTTTDQANEGFLKCLSAHSDDTQIKASDLSDTQQSTDNTSKAQGGDILKSAGEGVGTAAQGVGTGVGIAAKGVGEGVGAGAEGIGKGISAFMSAYTYPLIGGFICCCIVILILSFFIMKNPEAVQGLSQTAAESYKSLRLK